jgi:16S rRNA (guanine527-N7)-methyltransferase
LGSAERLIQDAAILKVPLTPADAGRLLALTEELARWNRSYNLTAIAPRDMLTHHVLDSLAVQHELHGTRIADAGTGAGFPGLPLAVCNPRRHFTLIDATAKKLRFVTHAVNLLGLSNVTVLHARVERLAVDTPFDTVLARAFAPLPQLLEKVAPLCGPRTRVLAMKGRWPESEIAAVKTPWCVAASRELAIPGLQAARCLIVLTQSQGWSGKCRTTVPTAATPWSP